jgi:helicase MOV-10
MNDFLCQWTAVSFPYLVHLSRDLILRRERKSSIHGRYSQKFRNSFTPFPEAAIRNFYCELFSSEHYDEVKRALRSKNLWKYNERSRVFFHFMISSMKNEDRLRENREGIEIIKGEQFSNPDGRLVVKFQIQNNSEDTIILKLLRISNETITVSHQESFPKTIIASERVDMGIICRSAVIGFLPSTVSFIFTKGLADQEIEMKRDFCFRRHNPALSELLKPTNPYQPRRVQNRNLNRRGGKILRGAKPPSSSQKFKHNLEEFPVTDNHKDATLIAVEEQYLAHSHKNLLVASTSTPESDAVVELLPEYSRHYQSMLHFEEIGLQNELDNYSSENAQFEKRGDFYWLEVPGLAEKRPSVLRGDEVEAIQIFPVNNDNNDDQTNTVKHRGFVWNVEQTRIQIRFHPNSAASFTPNARFSIRYLLKRTSIKIMHDTLRRISCVRDSISQDRISNLLFPKEQENHVAALEPVTLSHDLQLNAKQRLACETIVNNIGFSACPFILFGPPGTGKTHTLVSSIKQLMTVRPEGKLLILAPSNKATDLLVEKLSSRFDPLTMFRLMSFQRAKSDVSETVLNYCNDGFQFPPVAELQNYSLIVTTCSMSSKLFYYGFPANYFDTILIDESGHCWEPEALAAFMNFFSAGTSPSADSSTVKYPKLVLAGDPQQLGPVVRSTQGKSYGLSLSLLERLTQQLPVYAHDIDSFPHSGGYNPNYIVQLVECYRCHPAIIELPNQFFYNNSLVSSADPSIVNAFLGWNELPNPQIPMIFHGCVGENEQESNSPSWFNSIECEVILSYIQHLRHFGGFQLKDIGIITPYHKQVQKIGRALTTLGLTTAERNAISVGSCEQFQGQERRVIIISTVRSSVELFESDEYFDIGFVGNPKRFNVAITRAQALLIVIGNPKALNRDPHWGALLWHCVDNQCYRGCDLPSERSTHGGGGTASPSTAESSEIL